MINTDYMVVTYGNSSPLVVTKWWRPQASEKLLRMRVGGQKKPKFQACKVAYKREEEERRTERKNDKNLSFFSQFKFQTQFDSFQRVIRINCLVKLSEQKLPGW
ncbi:hypothetical protein RUM44_004629 [Polyplax serrata]|uniref:Uncharacterized protein n=1 Tax=Polyplax serrata TaxID=468196 RepID=A0ABR1B3G3_POLSC